MKTSTIHVGDVRTELAKLDAGSVQCCVTSPPYWGLRDYGMPGQIGSEDTIGEFISTLVRVFRGVRRVLRDDGTLWVNMGDCYNAQQGAGYPGYGGRNVAADGGMVKKSGLPPKNLIGQPWRLAFALQADGWILRSDIIWHKPNPMPESCTDRPTKSHEYVFLLTKKARYFYDAEAVKEVGVLPPHTRDRASNFKGVGSLGEFGRHTSGGADVIVCDGSRNLRTVWTVPTQSFSEAHFATFPERLVEPCLKAGTSAKGCCPECGAAWVRVVERTRGNGRQRVNPSLGVNRESGPMERRRADGSSCSQYDKAVFGWVNAKTTGWTPGCECGEDAHSLPLVVPYTPIPCTVLDPFSGSGTTGVVAKKLGLSYVGIELKPEYAEMSRRRIANPDAGRAVPDVPGQFELFDQEK